MSMKRMREYSKAFIWAMVIIFVASTFIIWGMQFSPSSFDNGDGGPAGAVVAVVNGEKVDYTRFYQVYQRLVDQRHEQSPDRELTSTELKQIREQAFKELTDQVLYDQEVKKHNISVTDEEIASELKNNPPEFLKTSFIDSTGNFNYSAYMSALQKADPKIMAQIEESLRDYLPRKKLQDKINTSVRVSDLEAWEDYVAEEEKVKIKYLTVDMNHIPAEKITITDDEVKSNYEAHKEEYKQTEQRLADYVLFELKAAPEDKQAVETKKAEIKNRLAAGASFAELAKQYSQDPGSGANGGDLGFFGKGAMVPQFETAAFALADGQVGDWVQSRFGWHLIMRHETKIGEAAATNVATPPGAPKPDDSIQIHASHILLKEEPSEATIVKIETSAREFAKKIKSDAQNFEKLAQETGLLVTAGRPIAQAGGNIPGLGKMDEAVDFIFSGKVDDISTVFEAPNNRGFTVFKIKQITPEGYRPLDQVSASIHAKLLSDKRLEYSGVIADSLYKVAQAGATLESIAQSDTSYKVEESEVFNRRSYVRNIGRDNEVTAGAFYMALNVISKPLKSQKGYYLIQVLEHREAPKDGFTAQKSTIKTRLLSQKQNSVLNDWYTDIREKAKIENHLDAVLNN